MTKPWPWNDSPIKRRERVALSYRLLAQQLAEKLESDACNILDNQMLEYGQNWIVPQVVPYDDDSQLTADQVAEYCGVSLKTVYMWRAQRGMPSIKTRDGIRFVFAEVRKWRGSR